MTDNDKMREIWDAHDEARDKAWREEPGSFDTIDAFKAGVEWQAAQSEQSAELERLRKDAGRLREALKHYGAHSNMCDMSRFINPASCTCGYSAAIAAKEDKK